MPKARHARKTRRFRGTVYTIAFGEDADHIRGVVITGDWVTALLIATNPGVFTVYVAAPNTCLPLRRFLAGERNPSSVPIETVDGAVVRAAMDASGLSRTATLDVVKESIRQHGGLGAALLAHFGGRFDPQRMSVKA